MLTALHGEWDPVVSPWKKDHPENTTEAFSQGCVKGAARSCTLHAILVVALDDKVNLKQNPGQGGAEWGVPPRQEVRLAGGVGTGVGVPPRPEVRLVGGDQRSGQGRGGEGLGSHPDQRSGRWGPARGG